MKRFTVGNTVLFWMLLLALSFGQERRDPTLPGPAIQQKLVSQPAEPGSDTILTLKALVLRDANHGTALLQTVNGTQRITLDRQPQPPAFSQDVIHVVDFDRSSITLQIGSRRCVLTMGSTSLSK